MKTTSKGKRIAIGTGVLVLLLPLLIAFAYRDEIRAWYEFRQLFDSLGRNAQGFPEYRHKPTGIIFVGLPGGTFSMGSEVTEADRLEQDEGPVHQVTLSSFLIAKYEVSQAQWESVMGRPARSKFTGPKLPVEDISWDHCKEFCDRAGLALPTEAQWEYACRAGTQTAYSTGEKITTDHANYNGTYVYVGAIMGENRGRTLPVDALEPNGFGLHHMHGNVWEACADHYDSEFYSKSEAIDPVCRSDTKIRVMRGGGWGSWGGGIRSARRHDVRHSRPSADFGFRPAWSRRLQAP